MILTLIVAIASSLAGLADGILAGILSIPFLEMLAQLTYGFLDANLP